MRGSNKMNFSSVRFAKLYAKATWNYKITPCFRRVSLKNRGYTVISNNCSAGLFGYKELGLQYATPTVGLFFFFEDYIRFISNLEHYLSIPIQFTAVSKYPTVNAHIKARGNAYPIGTLEDVEIFFIHYHSRTEAEAKWTRRAKRVKLENLFVMLVGDDNENVGNPDPRMWDPSLVDAFKKLPLKNKVIVPNPKEIHKNVLLVSGKSKERRFKYFSMVKWLNGEYSAYQVPS